mgnify:CR=1 FL=1
MKDILEYFPKELKNEMLMHSLEKLEEVRIRVNKPVILKIGQDELTLKYKVDSDKIYKYYKIFVTILFIHIKARFVKDI